MQKPPDLPKHTYILHKGRTSSVIFTFPFDLFSFLFGGRERVGNHGKLSQVVKFSPWMTPLYILPLLEFRKSTKITLSKQKLLLVNFHSRLANIIHIYSEDTLHQNRQTLILPFTSILDREQEERTKRGLEVAGNTTVIDHRPEDRCWFS